MPTAPATTGTTPQTPVSAPRATQSAEQLRPVKYTALLDHDTVDAFESLTRKARRTLGRHVDKVEILRALILLADDDASLRDQVIATLDPST